MIGLTPGLEPEQSHSTLHEDELLGNAGPLATVRNFLGVGLGLSLLDGFGDAAIAGSMPGGSGFEGVNAALHNTMTPPAPTAAPVSSAPMAQISTAPGLSNGP